MSLTIERCRRHGPGYGFDIKIKGFRKSIHAKDKSEVFHAIVHYFPDSEESEIDHYSIRPHQHQPSEPNCPICKSIHL